MKCDFKPLDRRQKTIAGYGSSGRARAYSIALAGYPPNGKPGAATPPQAGDRLGRVHETNASNREQGQWAGIAMP